MNVTWHRNTVLRKRTCNADDSCLHQFQ